jgi:Tol biopolymer transport system component
VAFESFATNLVAGGGDAFQDIYVHDRQIGITTRVSVDSARAEGNDSSTSPSISPNGRHVAFESFATNLVAGGGDAFQDIYVHDRDFDGNGTYDEAGGVSTVRVSVDSVGNEQIGESLFPSISGDGRYVAFQSNADLVVDDTLGFLDIYVHDRDFDGNGTYDEAGGIITVRVSVHSDGTEGNEASGAPSIAADGRYVAFVSDATNLVANDTNVKSDIFVHDRDADGNGIYDEPGPVGVSTARVSVDSVGNQGNENSNSPSISADGRYVAFESDADNLVADDNNGSTDVFVHDRQTGATTRVSVDLAGVEDTGDSNNPSISADGSSVTFQSDADSLVAGDTNFAPDIFVDDLQAGAGGGGGGGSSSGGGGCFIATAADGSRMAGEVK